MNCYKIVLDYINEREADDPIFIEEIKEHVATFCEKEELEKVFKNVNVIINRLKKEGIIKRAEKGIYYKPTPTIWGRETVPPVFEIRKYKYIIDRDGKIKGYITGARLFNMMGLTTQVPRRTDIATNACPNKNKQILDKYQVIIRKPKIEVTNENYQYLQLLDILANNDKIHVEVKNEEEVLYKYIKESDLDFEKLLKYARETNNKKALAKLWTLAR
ncbi:MAG: DUF6088 family protein [Oscillospiraceae bacterium]|nr:DUF6088 family protein [Oscillospiraceae bacterium]